MSQFHFSQSSLSKLEGVDERLKILAEKVLAISLVDFAITSGLRTTEEQYELFKQGKSKCDGINTLSKHQEGKAIDICPVIDGKLDYSATGDLFFIMGLFYTKAKELKENYDDMEQTVLRLINEPTAKECLDIIIRLGAFWDGNSIKNNKFIDGYHIELA
jgi:hypothetical protein